MSKHKRKLGTMLTSPLPLIPKQTECAAGKGHLCAQGSEKSAKKLAAQLSKPTINVKKPSLLKSKSIPHVNGHLGLVVDSILQVQEGRNGTSIDGYHLRIGDVVASARHDAEVILSDSPAVRQAVDASVNQIRNKLAEHEVLYGITTGYGGSADTRTEKIHELQRALIKLLSVGIITRNCTSCPVEIVRAAILVRLNTNIRGHSAVRWSVLQSMADMLNIGLVPQVPLRGSISASGDLIPFAAVVQCMRQVPNARVYERSGNEYHLKPARDTFQKHGIAPIELEAKEGLALLNGTSFSTAAASIAMHEANNLAVATQVLTALSVEAMGGTDESFCDFIQSIRPHWGQIETAKNIENMLRGSSLKQQPDFAAERGQAKLRQDRYSLRTAPQWIGPQLETLAEATRIVAVELNSTTDNPLCDTANDTVVHGGNFQALAITNAMESTRMALQHFARIIFAQHTELVNHKSNNGLSANLAFQEPSLDYGFKGVEISMASYMSEISYLANPVSTHVNTAELGNQGINSLAFVSARYTLEAVKILQNMLSAHLYALCQAINLRKIYRDFSSDFENLIEEITKKHFGSAAESILKEVTDRLFDEFEATGNMDSDSRFETCVDKCSHVLIKIANGADFAERAAAWRAELSSSSARTWRETHDNFIDGDAGYLLGSTHEVYSYILGLGIGVRRHDIAEGEEAEIGDQLSKIQESFESNDIYRCFLQCAVQSA